MYSILIVDDETRVREGLKNLSMWEELGFSSVLLAESAEEALKVMEEVKVDVMLTDIIMIEMDGLQLIKRVMEINPEIKTLILSAYGKFEYAKKALGLGVSEFLTKPVDFNELKKVCEHIIEILDKEAKLKRKKDIYFSLERDQFLNYLVKDFYKNEEDALKKSTDIGIDLNMKNYCVLRLYLPQLEEINDYAQRKAELIQLLEDKLEGLQKAYVFNNDLLEVAVIYCSQMDQDEKTLMEQYMEEVKAMFHYDLSIGIGRKYYNILDVEKSYKEAGKALEYRIFKRHKGIIYYKDILNFHKGKVFITDVIRNKIIHHLTLSEGDELIQFVEKLLEDAFGTEQEDIGSLYDTCVEVILIINKYVQNMVVNHKSLQEKEYATIKMLMEMNGYEAIKKFILEHIKNCVEIIRDVSNTSTGLIIENAKKYIAEHFNEDITLSVLASNLYIHPNYLSKLFKEKTGINFSDYVTKIRVGKAKELLGDVSLKIYKVSDLIGFSNPKYFGGIFKELTGMTPKEYREFIKGT